MQSVLAFWLLASTVYFPGSGDAWERKTPAEVGMDAARLTEALRFGQENESKDPRDLAQWLGERNKPEPFNELIGPTTERGGFSAIVLRNGFIVAEMGDTSRVDMTFSVTKSFVATTAGLAFDRGLIPSFDEPVRHLVKDGGFDSEHNRPITWHQLLQQTSEWEGTLWDKPDVADRRRGRDRKLEAPGTFWEYNDVRVNRTSLAVLRVLKEALPAVLKREVMDPIGASSTWQWHGYRNSYVDVDGARVQSVSGGGHWGGGLWISARDLARFGYLHLRKGKWGDKQILSEKWIARATTPCPIQKEYGYLWWLNTDEKLWPGVPVTSFAARGAGTNVVWVDPEHDLVVVLRWISTRQEGEVLKRILAAVKTAS